jgi:hypothetical protein
VPPYWRPQFALALYQFVRLATITYRQPPLDVYSGSSGGAGGGVAGGGGDGSGGLGPPRTRHSATSLRQRRQRSGQARAAPAPLGSAAPPAPPHLCRSQPASLQPQAPSYAWLELAAAQNSGRCALSGSRTSAPAPSTWLPQWP